IADLRATSGAGRFDLSLTSYAGDPPPPSEPLLPPPTPKEAIEQALFTARLTETAAEREALLNAALSALDGAAPTLPPDWMATTRAAARTALQRELRYDRIYQAWSARIIGRAQEQARQADVRGIQRLLGSIPRDDAVLGSKRPEAVTGLLAAVQAQLDV